MGSRKRKGSHSSHELKMDLEENEASPKKRMHQTKSFKLIFQLVLTAIFFVVELIVGYAGNSMALVADSFHMLSDVISLAVGLLAVRMAQKRTSKNTFGWVRAEVLGALVNSVFLLALCFSIFIESIKRLVQPEPVEEPSLVLYVGIAGLVINIIGMVVFSHHHSHDHGGHGHHHHHHHSHGESHGHHHHGHHKHNRKEGRKHRHKDEKTRHHEDDIELPLADDEKYTNLPALKVNEKPLDETKTPGSLHDKESLTNTSDTYNSTSALNKDPEEAPLRLNTMMSAQLTSPSFMCYFCRNSIPAASRMTGGIQPESCGNCREKSEVIILPVSGQTEVHMNGIGVDDCSEKAPSRKTCDSKKKQQNADQMNMRGVFLHIMGDFLGSIIVCMTAGTLLFCDKYAYCGASMCGAVEHSVPCWTLYLDPCLSIIMVFIILSSTIPLLKESAFILLQTVPTHIQIDRLQSELLEQVPSIKGMHELHVWQLAGNRIIASAHVQCQSPQEYNEMATAIKSYFHDMGIHSTTIQPEFIDTQSSPKYSLDTQFVGEVKHPTNMNYKSSTAIHGATGPVAASNGGTDNQTCLLMCGPEKSCGDQELCCPRDKMDQLRKRPGGGSTKLPLTEVSTEASMDASAVPGTNTNSCITSHPSVTKTPGVQVLTPPGTNSSDSQACHSVA